MYCKCLERPVRYNTNALKTFFFDRDISTITKSPELLGVSGVESSRDKGYVADDL